MGYAPADIACWAHQEQLKIVTGIAPVDCGGETRCGTGGHLGRRHIADVPEVRKRATGNAGAQGVGGVWAQGKDEWMMITEPAEGVNVSMDDLLILANEVHRFEAEREIFGRPHGGKGPEPKYNWDEF